MKTNNIELITNEEHSKNCNCNNFIEISKKNEDKLIILYKQCTKCWKFIKSNEVYDLNKDYY